MYRAKVSNVCLLLTVSIFGVISKIIFDRVYLTSKVVVDEEFHLTLGKAYCRFEYDKWHPKITTFPGLYVLSSLILGPLGLCTIYYLRLISLIFSVFNLYLFYHLLKGFNREHTWKNIGSALNMALLPPLYFFSHLYYTDVTSLTMVVLMFIFAQRGNHYLGSIFGMISVLFRQTNVIWVCMAFGGFVLRDLNALNQKKKTHYEVAPSEVVLLIRNLTTDLLTILKRTTVRFWLNSLSYGSLLVFFAIFVYANGSIVLGDKSAHEATINCPQIFYFALFTLFFAWPLFIGEIPNFARFIYHHKIASLLTLILSLVIVHFNTIVHPYVLADNRHYVFYIWNRFYGRHFAFRYLIVPVYLFAIFGIVSKLWKRDISFLIFFIPCTYSVLITQKLLEFRYFLIPYVLFRAQIKNISTRLLLYEFITAIAINACTLYLFETKTFYWSDFDYPQRLIW